MDHAQMYASRRLASGEAAEAVVGDLVASGWDPNTAWSLIASVGGRPSAPAPAPALAPTPAPAPAPARAFATPAAAPTGLIAPPVTGPPRPTLTRGSTTWTLVLTSVLLGSAFVLVTIVTFFSIFSSPGGPRGVLALFTDGGLPIGLYLAITVPLWVASLVTLLIARSRWRTELGGVRPRSALAGWAWFFVIGNPLLAAFAAALTFLLGLALGIMCGEAVSESCGTSM